MVMDPQQQRRTNVRIAWALASVVVLLFVGFIVKSAKFGI
jgi:hypothetical protein